MYIRSIFTRTYKFSRPYWFCNLYFHMTILMQISCQILSHDRETCNVWYVTYSPTRPNCFQGGLLASLSKYLLNTYRMLGTILRSKQIKGWAWNSILRSLTASEPHILSDFARNKKMSMSPPAAKQIPLTQRQRMALWLKKVCLGIKVRWNDREK